MVVNIIEALLSDPFDFHVFQELQMLLAIDAENLVIFEVDVLVCLHDLLVFMHDFLEFVKNIGPNPIGFILIDDF